MGEWSGRHARARARLDGSCAAVLTYHRVLPHSEAVARCVEPGMYVTPESFAAQLDWLTADFAVLPLGEIVARLAEGRGLPRGAVAISFDDGWQDNCDHALPALQRRGLPATVFLVTDRVGSPGAFWPDEVCRRLAGLSARERRCFANALRADPNGEPIEASLHKLKATPPAARERALDALRTLSPDLEDAGQELLDETSIERMTKADVSFEVHGASHALFTDLSDEELTVELESSRAWLDERGLGGAGLLAYPSGVYDDRVQRQVAAAGFRAAFTTERGLARRGGAALRYPRLGVHQDVSGSRAEFHRIVPGKAVA